MNNKPLLKAEKRMYIKKKARATPECQKCKKLILIGNRGRHVLWHLSRDQKINRYVCTICGYGSYDTTNLLYHAKKLHQTKMCHEDKIEDYQREAMVASEQCFGIKSLLQLPANRKKLEKFGTLSDSPNPDSSSTNFEFDVNQMAELDYDQINNDIASSSSSSQYLFESNQPDLLTMMLQNPMLVPFMKQEITETVDIQEDAKEPATVCKQDREHDSFEQHRFQISWEVDKVVQNVRAVAEKCNYPAAQIEKIVEIFEKNEVTGLTLSFEENDLSGFFEECKVVYGAKKAITHILTLMKFQDLKTQR